MELRLFIHILLIKFRQQSAAGQEFFIEEKNLDTLYGAQMRGACSKIKKSEKKLKKFAIRECF